MSRRVNEIIIQARGGGKTMNLNSGQELLILQSVAQILKLSLRDVVGVPHIELLALVVNRVKNDMIDVDDMLDKLMELRESQK